MSLSNKNSKNYTPAIVAACLLLLTALTDSHVVPAIAPQIASGLGTSKTFIAFSVSAYAVSAATIAITLAKYSSRIVISRYLLIATGIFAFAAIVTALSPHPAVFFIARTIGGLAGGLISALTIAGIANTTDYKTRGKQMSGVAVCYLLAPVLGVPLGTFIADLFTWRALFLLTLTMALAAGLLSYFYSLPNIAISKNPSDESLENEPSKTQSSWATLWQLATRSSATRRGILGAFFVSGGLVGFVTYLGIWLSDAFYLKTSQIGFIYALVGVTAVAGGAIGGIFSDKIGKQKMIVQSSKLMALFLLILPTFNKNISFFVIMGIVSILAAIRIAPLQALVTEIVEPNERPSYIALRNTASQIGIALAVAISGQVYISYGMAGVCLICSLLTIGAWYSIKGIPDPEGKVVFIRKSIPQKLVKALVALVLIIVIALPWLLSFFVTKALTRPDERIRKDTPLSQGVDYQDIEFPSFGGNNKLSGWYLPSRTEKITFIMTHGMFRSRYEMLDRAVALWKGGYGVLLYDLRRHGKSVAEFSTLGFYEQTDVIGAVKFAREKAPENKIVLMGVSMGAAATLLASEKLANSPEAKEIIAVVAESSFLSFENTIYHHCKRAKIPQIPFAFVLTNLIAWRMNFSVTEFDLLSTVKKIPYPVLFIGGTSDTRMPNETVLEPLYQACPSSKKAKYLVNGATHGKAYEVEPETYVKTIVEFLEKIEEK